MQKLIELFQSPAVIAVVVEIEKIAERIGAELQRSDGFPEIMRLALEIGAPDDATLPLEALRKGCAMIKNPYVADAASKAVREILTVPGFAELCTALHQPGVLPEELAKLSADALSMDEQIGLMAVLIGDEDTWNSMMLVLFEILGSHELRGFFDACEAAGAPADKIRQARIQAGTFPSVSFADAQKLATLPRVQAHVAELEKALGSLQQASQDHADANHDVEEAPSLH